MDPTLRIFLLQSCLRTWSADDGAGSGGGGGGGTGGDGAGDAGDGAGNAGGDGDGGDPGGAGDKGKETAPERPEWIAEKFWKPDYVKGKEIDYTAVARDMAEHHRAAESKIFTRKDALKKEVQEELEAATAEARKNLPASPDAYKINLPAKIVPEGLEFKIDEQNPMMTYVRQIAHERGLPQSEFDKIIEGYVKSELAQMPDYESEAKKLGDHGELRIERANAWARQNLSAEAYKVIESLAVTADAVKAVEELMVLAGSPAFQIREDGTPKEALTREDLQKMQDDPRYYRDQEPAFVRQVQAGFRALAKQQR